MLFVLTSMQDLVGWDRSNISDPHSIKGAIAELAASIGPDLVEQTMIDLHL